MVSASIGGDQHGVFGGHQFGCNLLNGGGISALRLNGQVILLAIRTHALSIDRRSQHLSGQGEVNRPCGVTLHHSARPRDHFVRHGGPCQVVFPLHIGPNHTGLIERLLDEMHIGVAPTGGAVKGAHGCAACNQQHGNAGATQIVQAHGCIGGACINVHQHRLASPCCHGIAPGHVNSGIFMRAQNDFWKFASLLTPMSHLLNEWRVIGT